MSATKLPCSLAQDLLIPYAAGEVQQVTQDWMNEHLESCPACQAALQEVLGANLAVTETTPAPPPAADDRQVVGRVRRGVLLIIGVAALLGLLGIGGLTWTFLSMRSWANMPVYAPPSAQLSPRAVIELDLSSLGLFLAEQHEQGNQATLVYRDAAGRPITLEATRFGRPEEARAAYRLWNSIFGAKMMSVTFELPSQASTKFRSAGRYFYGWQGGNWLITVDVPGAMEQPAALRDQIRDRIFETNAAR